ncbi:unnamed protein product [Angiostrongylus costaricensis]|uniref:Uncharacterized protein n=1 Tax=Angiostrongylus costaricensis TaxID=334426 RepID=A0A0R3Q099_ANGCS|nr:unnamed protein product [Angiostrongylus costaricensis]
MVSPIRILLIGLLLLIEAGYSKPLMELFENMMKKNTEIKSHRLMQFISKAVPYGIEPPNPKIAEYETFKSDKSANFLHDGKGNVVFREFRRLRLADIVRRPNEVAVAKEIIPLDPYRLADLETLFQG